VIVAKLAVMHAHEPTLTHDDLSRITCRALVMVADDDEVRLEHAVELYRSLPDAELAVVPGTSDGLLVEKPDLCDLLITEFLIKDPSRPSHRSAGPHRRRHERRPGIWRSLASGAVLTPAWPGELSRHERARPSRGLAVHPAGR
jgi:hypothetical protein